LSKRTISLLFLVLSSCIWGLTFLVTKNTLGQSGPFTLTALRFIVAALTLLPFAWKQGFRFNLTFKPAFIRYGLMGVTLTYLLQNVGLVFTSAANAALLHVAFPAIIALFSYLFLREKVPAVRIFGIAVSMIGVYLIVQSSFSHEKGSLGLLGDLMILANMTTWAIYTVQGKKLVMDYPSTVITMAGFCAGLLFLIPLALVETAVIGPPHLALSGVISIIFLGAGASALAVYLWNYALRYIEGSVVAIFTNLNPVVGIIAAAVAGEVITALQLVGAGIAVFGVWLTNQRTPRFIKHTPPNGNNAG